jgi:hypothetical protein
MHHASARLLTAILLFFLSAGLATAQDPPGPTGNTSASADAALLQQLLNISPGKIFVLHGGNNDATTVNTANDIFAVWGEVGSGSLSDAENTAKQFVRTYGRLLGFPAGEPLVAPIRKFREWPKSGTTDDGGKFLQYCTALDGPQGPHFYLPSMVVFCFRSDGKLVAVIGRSKPIVAPRVAAGTAEEAIARATRLIELNFPESKGKISGNGEIAEYLTDGFNSTTEEDFIRRVFVVGLTVGDPPMPKRAIIGGPEDLIEDARQLENSCDVFEWDPGTSYATVNRDLVDLIHPGFIPDWTVNGTHFKVDPRITTAVARASDWNGWWDEEPKDPTDPNPKFGELHVYYHLTEARKKALGWGATKDVEKHDPLFFDHWIVPRCTGFMPNSAGEKACEERHRNNAWFNPYDTTLNFASSNVTFTNRYPAYDASVIYHEYGHFVHKMLSEHWKQGVFDGGHQMFATVISEGFADLYAASCTGQAKVAGWYMAKKKKASGSGTEDKSRNLDSPMTMTRAVQENMSPHDGSQMFSSALWKLRSDNVLAGDAMIKTAIAAMRLCRLPCDVENAAMAVLAADQMLTSSPHTQKIGERLNAQHLLPPLRSGP